MTIFLSILPLLLFRCAAAMVSSAPPPPKNEATPERRRHHLLIERRLQHCETVEQVMALLSETSKLSSSSDWRHDEGLYEQALCTCGKLKNSAAALEILQHVPHSEQCRSRAISICGNHGRLSDALRLLQEWPPLSNPGPYNAAIAACGHAKNWVAALTVLNNMPQHLVTRTTLHAVLTTLAKTRRGDEALNLVQKMESKWHMAPDRIAYHNALSALLASGHIEQGCQLVRTMAERNETAPNQETWNRVAAAVAGKAAERNLVLKLLGDHMSLMDNNNNTTTQQQTAADATGSFANFCHWQDLPKVGRGKSAYWKLGELIVTNDKAAEEEEPVIVGLVPNRNAASNGVRLTFYRKRKSDVKKDEKLGYLLMVNHRSDPETTGSSSSQFLGQFVKEEERGRGWAKVWLAVWLQLCLDAHLQPRTGHMQKPLLCLVLQHSFGMVPHEGGVHAELSPAADGNGGIVLYSSARALEGAFSPLDLRKQNIQLSLVPTEPRGRPVVVCTAFEWPGRAALQPTVEAAWEGTSRRFCLLDGLHGEQKLRDILLGM